MTVPTYDGSGRSTHPSVVDMVTETGHLFGGFRWWFADTPYPNMDDQYENPEVFATNNRAVWTVPPGQDNPLVGPPPGGFNSDTELEWDPDNNRFVLYWRDYVSSRSPQMYLRVAHSSNGTDWTIRPLGESEVMTAPTVSPSICRVSATEWRMWRFGTANPPGMWTATSSLGPWTYIGPVAFTGYSGIAWHGDVKLYDGIYYGMLSTTTGVQSDARPFVVSTDGLTWTIGPVLPFQIYRPTFAPSTEAGQMDIWVARSQRVYYHRLPLTTWTDL